MAEWEQIQPHVRVALDKGATPQEILEALQSVVIPMGMLAFRRGLQAWGRRGGHPAGVDGCPFTLIRRGRGGQSRKARSIPDNTGALRDYKSLHRHPVVFSNYLKMARRHCRRNHRSAHASCNTPR